jgi:hypothetical protein
MGGPDGNVQIATMTADGHDLRAIASGRGIHEVPSWSPNGRRIVFVRDRGLLSDPRAGFNEGICVMDADGSNIVNLTSTPGVFENWPSWGPAPRDDDDDERNDDGRDDDGRDDDERVATRAASRTGPEPGSAPLLAG